MPTATFLPIALSLSVIGRIPGKQMTVFVRVDLLIESLPEYDIPWHPRHQPILYPTHDAVRSQFKSNIIDRLRPILKEQFILDDLDDLQFLAIGVRGHLFLPPLHQSERLRQFLHLTRHALVSTNI